MPLEEGPRGRLAAVPTLLLAGTGVPSLASRPGPTAEVVLGGQHGAPGGQDCHIPCCCHK